MKNRSKGLLVLIVACGTGYLGYYYGSHHAGEKTDKAAAEEPATSGEEKKATAHVETATVKVGEIVENIKTYGTVTAQPDKVQSVSLAYECRVVRVLVSPGESVAKDAPIVEIEPSPETQLAFDEAKSSAEAAAKELEQTRQRFQSKLATNQEMGAAEQASQSAQNKFLSLKNRGVEGRKSLTAEADGLVGDVKVQPGQIVAAGTPLLDVVAGSQIEVKLTVEPGEIMQLRAGQAVTLASSSGEASVVEGKIRLVTHKVNAEGRTVDVFVSLPDDSHFLLNDYVSAEIAIKSAKNAILVPRSAVLPDGEEWVLYIVQDHHAVKKTVKKGVETDGQVEITRSDLHENDVVVVTGNYELENGMSVEAP